MRRARPCVHTFPEVTDKSRMEVTAISLSGMETARSSLEKTARRIASPEKSGDRVDPGSDVVALMAAENQFAASAATFKTDEGMQKRLLDLFA
jgi:hypothetical protein